VNGVINIITKNARDTQGGLVSAGAGTEERGFGTARYGWQPSENQYARIYAKSFERDTGFSPTGNARDDSRMSRAGFRWDWDASARDTVRISGDVYSGEAGERNSATDVQDVEHQGGNLLARWTRELSETESLRAQFYYDRIELDNLQLGEERDTYDLELHHSFAPAERHQIVWGLGYRDTRDDIRNGPMLSVDPTRRKDQTASAFIQDTIALTPERLHLTLGTKVESTDYADTEWQPNARLAWTPDERRVYWAAASRAVRVPSRLEADLAIGGIRLGDDVVAETVRAYELGHRRLVTTNFWYDVATFYNVYRHLLTTGSFPTPFSNQANARTYGVELAARWQATPSWRLDAAYTYLQMEVAEEANATAVQGADRGQNPHHQLTLRSAFDLGRNLEFDATLRFVDDLPTFDVPAYTELDLGLSWHPRSGLELSLVGQNLLDSHHPEQEVVANDLGTEVQRGVYLKVTWRY
jgi:iron complex outermembrane receptor protein